MSRWSNLPCFLGFLLTTAIAATLSTPVSSGDKDAPAKTVKVLVAKRDLAASEELTEPEKLFTWATYRAGEEPADAVTFFIGLDWKVLGKAVPKGFPLMKGNVHEKPISVEIPEGHQG